MLLEHVAHDEGHAPHVVPAHARPGVEIDAQLVGMLEVVGAYGMRVQVDAAQVHDPHELRRVAHDDLSRRPPRGKAQLHRLDPPGPLLGGTLLEERLALGAVHVALEHDRPRRDPWQRRFGDRHVVLRQVQLRVPGLRKEHLVRVRDHHLATAGFKDGLLRPRHGTSVAEFTLGAREVEETGSWRSCRARPGACPRPG
jgi:hypothetical protein